MNTYVTITTDGACKGNPGPGGWAALLQMAEHRKMISGRMQATTNNRMELMAVAEGLEALKWPCAVEIISDSKYVIDGATQWLQGWKTKGWRTSDKKPVKNADLWRRIDVQIERHAAIAPLRWQWVRGHAAHAGNLQVDAKASEEAYRVSPSDPKDQPE